MSTRKPALHSHRLRHNKSSTNSDTVPHNNIYHPIATVPHKLRGLSPRANYTDRAATAGRQC